MQSTFAPKKLPNKRTGRFLDLLDRQNILKLAVCGVLLYISVVLIFSILECCLHTIGQELILDNNGAVVNNFFDILYFNFVTILTVGYGDFHPVSIGKLFSVIEAFVGVGLFGVLVALITTKSLLPSRNTIVFSKYSYYCTEPECFLIIFVNTSTSYLSNTEISSYFKLGGDWGVKPSIKSPFLTQAVQTFFIEKVYLKDIISNLKEGDRLRIGLTGQFRFTNFSTSIQYSAEEILVIPNRDELTSYEGFWRPNFTSSSFKQWFHYKPEGAPTLKDYVEEKRG